MRPHVAILGILLASATSCGAEWKQIAPARVAAYGDRQEMEIWRHGDAVRWHAVRVDSSTVSGIPFFKSPLCDSCRVSVPRASVDSIRVGDTDGAFWRTLTLVLGLSVMAFYIKSAIAS